MGVQHSQKESFAAIIEVLKSAQDSLHIKQDAASMLAATIEESGDRLAKSELSALARELQALGDASLRPSLDRALKATDIHLQKQ